MIDTANTQSSSPHLGVPTLDKVIDFQHVRMLKHVESFQESLRGVAECFADLTHASVVDEVLVELSQSLGDVPSAIEVVFDYSELTKRQRLGFWTATWNAITVMVQGIPHFVVECKYGQNGTRISALYYREGGSLLMSGCNNTKTAEQVGCAYLSKHVVPSLVDVDV